MQSVQRRGEWGVWDFGMCGILGLLKWHNGRFTELNKLTLKTQMREVGAISKHKAQLFLD